MASVTHSSCGASSKLPNKVAKICSYIVVCCNSLLAGAAEACAEGGHHDGWTRITFSQNAELGIIIPSAGAIEVVRINTKGEMLYDGVRFFIPHKYL